MMWDATQIALIREAAIAGNSLSAGLSAMRKANFAKLGLYGESFFSLSIGLERLLKIVCLLDFVLAHNKFPSDKELKAFGHDLEDLFVKVDDIGTRHKVKSDSPVLADGPEDVLFKFISRFSKSTMYFNLEFFNGVGQAGHSRDPVSEWFDDVAKKIFDLHLAEKQKTKLRHGRPLIDRLVGNFSMVGGGLEDAVPLAKVEAAQAELNKVLQKYVPFYAARLCRFLYEIMLAVMREAQSQVGFVEIPSLDGLFFPFATDDASLLTRKTFPTRA